MCRCLDPESIHQVPLGETIYWLDRKGASLVAGFQGKSLAQFKWRRKPRFSQIEHDLRVNDFRIAVREACRVEVRSYISKLGFLKVNSLHSLTEFHTRLQQARRPSRSIRPDGYFMIERKPNLGATKPFSFCSRLIWAARTIHGLRVRRFGRASHI